MSQVPKFSVNIAEFKPYIWKVCSTNCMINVKNISSLFCHKKTKNSA